MIQEVLDVKPDKEYVAYDEVVIIGYDGRAFRKFGGGKKPNPIDIKSCLAEGKRVIESLPRLDIAAFQDKLVQFNFKFDLRSTIDRSPKMGTPDRPGTIGPELKDKKTGNSSLKKMAIFKMQADVKILHRQ